MTTEATAPRADGSPGEDARPAGQAGAARRLSALSDGIEGDWVTLGEIVDRMGHAGFGLALLVITVVVLIPVPGPLGMVLGTIIALVAFQLLIGARRLWLPGFVRTRSLPGPALRAMLDRIVPWIERAEAYMKPRRMIPLSGRGARVLLSIPIMALGAAITLPIPLGNFMPALALIVFSLGLMARDGVAIIVALILTAAALVWTAALVLAGAEILDFLFGWIG